MPVLFRTTGTIAGPSILLRSQPTLRDAIRRTRVPIMCAVMERADGLVLINAGWSRAQCAFPFDDPGWIFQLATGMDVHAEDALASQLITLGYDPHDVRHVIATDLRMPHIGGVIDFPAATLHTTPAEWRSAMARGSLGGYPHDMSRFADRVRMHAFTSGARLGFTRSHDVFGDGTVLMLDASGHTAGSLAIAVQLEAGWLVHAGGACLSVSQIAKPPLFSRLIAHDRRDQRETIDALERARTTFAARVVCTHDPEDFVSLPMVREDAWPTVWDKAPKAPRKKQATRKGSTRQIHDD